MFRIQSNRIRSVESLGASSIEPAAIRKMMIIVGITLSMMSAGVAAQSTPVPPVSAGVGIDTLWGDDIAVGPASDYDSDYGDPLFCYAEYAYGEDYVLEVPQVLSIACSPRVDRVLAVCSWKTLDFDI